MKRFIVTVDGTAGSGKSRLITNLSSLLDGTYRPITAISSGHLYRAVALITVTHVTDIAADINDAKAGQLLNLVKLFDLRLIDNQAAMNKLRMGLGLLKAEEVTAMAPFTSQIPAIREYVNDRLRETVYSLDGLVLVDGRDAAAVFDQADCKLFLTASDEVGARRLGGDVEAVAQRNRIDRERLIAPTAPASDAIVIDTDSVTEGEVALQALNQIENSAPEIGALMRARP